MLDARIAEGLQEVGGVEVDEVGIARLESPLQDREGLVNLAPVGVDAGKSARRKLLKTWSRRSDLTRGPADYESATRLYKKLKGC
jgi:hypothetical protein